ncbi:non-ribosomal peptide synthetase [Streptomyces sp. MST-110588]|uniref:non-ribosomal peptide synthetase n=1 Tax=Streptomyces sp. MST-110588 TaxID=2833628 RepID=UPI001F5CFBBB|nr:non-ribosomal peptide synthetase [Streptomyces sp. MST-110588]UNO40119.1 non-ribosomal peptide synthetase [Streptomyces sp. MST-110588]
MDVPNRSRPLPIGEIFARRARSAPGRVAVSGEDGELTYGELDDRSDRLARRLQDLGVVPGDVVALDGARRVTTVIGLLGILKAGAAYLALEHRYPAERRRLVLRDAGVRFVLTHADVSAERPAELPSSCTPVSLEGELPDLLPRPTEVTADHVAYLAYTSGSTGAPKGVCIPHRAVSRLVVDSDFLPVAADDVFLQFAPLAFDASTLEVWGPLLNGARLELAPERELSAGELTKHVRCAGVTVLWLTAGLFQQVVDNGLEDLQGLRYLVAGGDVLSPAHVNRALAALGDTVLINGYGPTENTTFTCCHTVTEPVSGSVPIGRPIRGTGVYILDAALRPVADGRIGELFATGEGLAHGYLNCPELTAQRFLPDPFSPCPGGRMYRTGDLVSRLEDGTLEYHGRADGQVKIRGFRIEPGEVESAVCQLPGVTAAAVVAQSQPSGGKRLVAYVTGRPASLPATLDLRRQLAGTLPSYAVPSLIQVVDALPLTTNGKIDRAALAAAETACRPDLRAAYRKPRTPTETVVVRLWSDLLGIEGIGADDDFFELGGHSLVGVRITADLRREYGVEISPVTFYLDPTPAGLAAAIDAAREAA